MTITKEGALASFYTVNKAPIKHLKVYFSPKQAGEGTPSPENVREISGHTGVELTHCGKNIFDKSTGIQLQSVNLRVARNPGYGVPVQLKSGIPYVFSQNGKRKASEIGVQTPYTGIYIKLTYETYLKYTPTADEAVALNAYWEGMKRPEDSTDFQVEIGTQATEYEPYRGQTHIIDWTEDVGTVYGGYVDLVTGELVKTHNLIHYDGTENWEIKTSTNNPTNSPYTARIYVSDGFRDGVHYSTVYSNKLKPEKNYYTQLYGVSLSYNSVFNVGTPSQVSDISSFRTWMNDIQGVDIIYPLQNPITHQLSPTQLSTLIGRNNIWSNADHVEVEYDLAESNDELYHRRNILLRSAPHIETTSGNIAHFETDIAAPIKSAKISFSPVQEGSGDPSLENVRSISGWSGIELTRCGKNLLNLSNVSDNQIWYNGNLISWNSTYFATDKIQVMPGATYVGSGRDSAQNQYDFFDENENYIQQTFITGANIVTIPNNAKYITTQFLSANKSIAQFELGSTPTSYEPYTGITIPINWQTAAGTIYGGYVDLVTGELVETYIARDLSAIKWSVYSTNNLIYSPDYESRSGQTFCDKMYSPGQVISWNSQPNLSVFFIKYYKGIFVRYNTTGLSGTEYEADFKAFLNREHPIFVFPRITPIHYQLSPQSLRSLRGTNNIWSNANGPVEIKYWTH